MLQNMSSNKNNYNFEIFLERLREKAFEMDCLFEQRASIDDFKTFLKNKYQELYNSIFDDSNKIYKKIIEIYDFIESIKRSNSGYRRITMNIFIDKYLKHANIKELNEDWDDEELNETVHVIVKAFDRCPGQLGDSRMGSQDELFYEVLDKLKEENYFESDYNEKTTSSDSEDNIERESDNNDENKMDAES